MKEYMKDRLPADDEQRDLPRKRKAKLKVIIPCRFVRREGESCRANNNCTYPKCEEK